MPVIAQVHKVPSSVAGGAGQGASLAGPHYLYGGALARTGGQAADTVATPPVRWCWGGGPYATHRVHASK